jgi:hypothetical protein
MFPTIVVAEVGWIEVVQPVVHATFIILFLQTNTQIIYDIRSISEEGRRCLCTAGGPAG